MARCYRCNATLPAGVLVDRRRVLSGESEGVSFGTRSVRASSRNYFRQVPFCGGCAAEIDRQRAAAKLRSTLLFLVLFLPCSAIVVCSGGTNAPSTTSATVPTTSTSDTTPQAPPPAETSRAVKTCILRSEGSVNADRVGRVERGMSVNVEQRSGGWVQVRSGDAAGWIAAGCLE